MREILLTQRKITYVDDEAYDILAHYAWQVFKHGWPGYRTPMAGRIVFINGLRISQYLHRILAGVPSCFRVRWINGNKLDNRYENLIITDKKNNKYKFHPFTGKTTFKGIRWNAYYGLWETMAYKMSIGFYSNEIDAARAYNVKIREIFPKPGRDRLNSIPIMNRYLRNNGEE